MQESLDAEGLGHLVPTCWRNKPTGTTDVFGRLYWKRPAFTIRTEFYKPEKVVTSTQPRIGPSRSARRRAA